ncbi:hypothetical protein K8W59_16610 [Nocardioides rotundus]|uniref:LamG-like jellyroll fold domain-containing protein n=1 Tax=Nocardioides rotundus TaxID=1774216 RepID=UPI001CC0CB06|nr:LamG-like jellyroll fold domain-containing protein [Nocardioides rotundus]UAL29366.1 hypothetical protein K8W59_16610 [Nocardioides rotundus]
MTLTSRLVIAVAGGLLLWAVLPAVIGWQPTTVSSGSMSPLINPGDVVAAKPVDADEIKVGQILLVDDPDHPDRLRLHRLIRQEDDGLVLLASLATRRLDDQPAGPEEPVTEPAASGGRTRRRRPVPGPLPVPWRRPAFVVGVLAVVAVVVVGLFVELAGTPSRAAYSATTETTASFERAAPSYREEVLADGPRIFLRGDSGDPTFDSSGNSTPMISDRISIRSVNDRPESYSALYMGNPESYLSAVKREVPQPMNFTLELWVKSTATGRLIGMGSEQIAYSGAYDRLAYIGTDGKARFGVGPWGTTLLTSPQIVNDGQWHHIVGTHGQNTTTLYIDGVKVASGTGPPQGFEGFWRIGRDNLGGWQAAPANTALDGLLDDVAIYDRVLPAERVAAHYEAGKP